MANGYDARRAIIDKHMQELQRDGFSLANYYFVFQGVIFTAFFTSASSLKCHYRWLPLVLSAIAGCLNLCALLVIAFKYKKLLERRDGMLTSEEHDPEATPLQNHTPEASSVQNHDPEASPVQNQQRSRSVLMKFESKKRMVYIFVCLIFFAGFLGLTVYGCLKFPCIGLEDSTGNRSNSNENCVKLCDPSHSNKCIRICQ